MCITVVSTSHPRYPFILVNNRDEFIGRPTAQANWWSLPNENILGGRDLHRPEKGSWLGMTKDGKLACLTNYYVLHIVTQPKSRGALVTGVLRLPASSLKTTNEIGKELLQNDLSAYGGFNLMFGSLKRPSWKYSSAAEEKEGSGHWKGLGVISNKSTNDVEMICVNQGETHALSNTIFDDKSWPKLFSAKKLIAETIESSAKSNESPRDLVERLLKVLSTDTFPQVNGDFSAQSVRCRESIYIPPLHQYSDKSIGPESGLYGTQQQTVILVDWNGHVSYFERTLMSQSGNKIATGKGDVSIEFDIDDW